MAEAPRKRRRPGSAPAEVEPAEEDHHDYKCGKLCPEALTPVPMIGEGVCGLSYQETVARLKEGRVEVECEECAPTFAAIEREYASELRKLRKKRLIPTKKEGLRSKELVPEGNMPS